MRYQALLTLTLRADDEDKAAQERRLFYNKLDILGWEKHKETETTWSKSKSVPSIRHSTEDVVDSFIEEIKNNLHDAAASADIGTRYDSVFTVGLGKNITY